MRSRAIAIAGAKGSPGCSFLAVALARFLAAGNMPTLLLDCDSEGGGLAALLDAPPVTPVRPLDENAFDEQAVQIERCLWFAELDQTNVGSFNGLEALSAARVRHRAVVVDLGHNAGGLQRQASAASDWLLWVVVPDRSGLDRADKALGSAALGAANVGLVINRIRPGCLDRADEVLSGRHRMPVLARINEDRHIADRLSQGLPIHGERSVRRTLIELARSVHPDVGISVPA
jgi:MinD superfamily P-loop ATPase